MKEDILCWYKMEYIIHNFVCWEWGGRGGGGEEVRYWKLYSISLNWLERRRILDIIDGVDWHRRGEGKEEDKEGGRVCQREIWWQKGKGWVQPVDKDLSFGKEKYKILIKIFKIVRVKVEDIWKRKVVYNLKAVYWRERIKREKER